MKPSASKLALLRACAYPFNGQKWPEQTSGDVANLGSAYHQIIAELVNHPGQRPLAEVYADAVARYSVDATTLAEMQPENAALLESPTARAEVAFAWDWVTGNARELGQDIGRDYHLIETEIAGTADIIDGDVIADWKTGREAPAAEGNAQLLFLAMCANKLGLDISRIQIRHVKPDGTIWHDTAEIGPFDLDIFEEEIKAIIANPNPQPKPGTHCRYCPVLATCPKALETLAEKDDKYPLALRGIDSIQSPQHAEWLLHRIDAAEELLSSVKAKVREYADANGAFELSNGKKWGPYVVVRETIQGSREKLIEAGIPESLIEYSVAKGAVEKHAKEGAEKGQGAAAVRAIFEKLRDAGCVKESMFTKYEARK